MKLSLFSLVVVLFVGCNTKISIPSIPKKTDTVEVVVRLQKKAPLQYFKQGVYSIKLKREFADSSSLEYAWVPDTTWQIKIYDTLFDQLHHPIMDTVNHKPFGNWTVPTDTLCKYVQIVTVPR